MLIYWGYSNAISYGSFTDKRDGKRYKTVKIGKTTWMAENLNWQVNGLGITCYERNRHYCKQYGALYDYERSLTACPDGWCLPKKNEAIDMLEVLEKKRRKNETRVTAIKAEATWVPTDDDHFEYDNKSGSFYATQYEEPKFGTNRIGFSALAAGVLVVDGNEDSYRGLGEMTWFWVDSDVKYTVVNGYSIRTPTFDNSIQVGRSFYDVLLGGAPYERWYLSIRCVKK